jgi:hypothetical protein
MREFVIDIKSLVIKHWGKLIVIYLLGSFILNFNDVLDGFNEGWNSSKKEAQGE